jgi:hypothetical protein
VGSRQEGDESAIGIIRLRFEREGHQRDSVIDEAGSAEIVQRAADGGLPLAEEVGIDHRCSDVFVTEEFLHDADGIALETYGVANAIQETFGTVFHSSP